MMAGKKSDGRERRRALFQSMVSDLVGERAELSVRIAEIDAELAEYGGAAQPAAAAPPVHATRSVAAKAKPAKAAKAGRKAGGRPPRPGSLKAVILKVLGRTPMSPAQIAAAVQGAGYDTSSKHLSQRIGVACAELIKANSVIRRGRGQYTRA